MDGEGDHQPCFPGRTGQLFDYLLSFRLPCVLFRLHYKVRRLLHSFRRLVRAIQSLFSNARPLPRVATIGAATTSVRMVVAGRSTLQGNGLHIREGLHVFLCARLGGPFVSFHKGFKRFPRASANVARFVSFFSPLCAKGKYYRTRVVPIGPVFQASGGGRHRDGGRGGRHRRTNFCFFYRGPPPS